MPPKSRMGGSKKEVQKAGDGKSSSLSTSTSGENPPATYSEATSVFIVVEGFEDPPTFYDDEGVGVAGPPMFYDDPDNIAPTSKAVVLGVYSTAAKANEAMEKRIESIQASLPDDEDHTEFKKAMQRAAKAVRDGKEFGCNDYLAYPTAPSEFFAIAASSNAPVQLQRPPCVVTPRQDGTLRVRVVFPQKPVGHLVSQKRPLDFSIFSGGGQSDLLFLANQGLDLGGFS